MTKPIKNTPVDTFKDMPNLFTKKTPTTVEDSGIPSFVEKDFGEPSVNVQPSSKTGYLNNETGYVLIEDQNEIDSLKLRQSADVLKNLLLGHYDKETGEYIVSENLLIELLLIVKKLERSFKLSNFCSSLSNFNGFGSLEFVVQTKYKENSGSSNLYLLETVDKLGGLIENTNVVLVANYEDNFVTRDEYVLNMFKAFNIYDPSIINDEDYVINENANLWIIRRKMFLQALNTNMLAKQNFYESKLLNKRMAILSQLGPFGIEVIQAFETLKAKGKKLLGEELTGRDLNEMLELSVQSMNGKYKELQAKYYTEQKEDVAAYNTEIERLKETETKSIQTKLGPKPAKPKIGSPSPEMFPKGLKLPDKTIDTSTKQPKAAKEEKTPDKKTVVVTGATGKVTVPTTTKGQPPATNVQKTADDTAKIQQEPKVENGNGRSVAGDCTNITNETVTVGKHIKQPSIIDVK